MIIQTNKEILDLCDLSITNNDNGLSKRDYFKNCFSNGLYNGLEEFEKDVLKYAIKNSKNYSQAASILSISRANLYEKAKRYSIKA